MRSRVLGEPVPAATVLTQYPAAPAYSTERLLLRHLLRGWVFGKDDGGPFSRYAVTPCATGSRSGLRCFAPGQADRVKAPMAAPGYGSKLVERSVSGQLRGSIAYDWAKDGVVLTVRLDPEKLGR